MERFAIDVPEAVLQDLRERLGRTRWPDQVEGAGWDYGTERGYLQALCAYWRDGFDWRAQERRLNRLPQFKARVGGLDLHFVHARGAGPDPFPLIITHGWPSTFAEPAELVGPLTDPARYGGDPADSFDVVIPSLPGFGFSERPLRRGLVRVDALWRLLMTEVLGYRRFAAHGTDVGARVTSALGRFHSDVVAAIHIASVDLDGPDPAPPPSELSAEERDYLSRVSQWERTEGAYAEVQGTRPQTLAYGLADSPAGLAGWIVEKFRAWSDCGGDVERRFTRDQLLTNLTIYWATGTINASMRRYYETWRDPSANRLRPGERIPAPTAVAMFPGERELQVPRSWAERGYNLVRWTQMPRGGHFPALEEPDLLVADLREFFRGYRRG
jgi:pimeloyl-ACP methyl ester carboxylesterase